jgi:hypothetical protein
MAGANLNFNGTTLSFNNAAVGKIQSIAFSNVAKEVDVSGADEDELVEAGQKKIAVSVEIAGGSALLVGAKGAVVIVWKDASSSPALNNAILLEVSPKGSKNSPITTSLKFAKSTDAAS